LVATVAAFLAVGCASVPTDADDPICTELSRFANASTGQFPRAVVLRGGWGGDLPGTLMTHECKPQGGGSAEEFCSYLASNTSWEFGRYTVERVAACFRESESRRSISALTETGKHAQVSVANPWDGSGDAILTISFTPASGRQTLYRFEIVANDSRPL
jgi:hypothetical protein